MAKIAVTRIISFKSEAEHFAAEVCGQDATALELAEEIAFGPRQEELLTPEGAKALGNALLDAFVPYYTLQKHDKGDIPASARVTASRWKRVIVYCASTGESFRMGGYNCLQDAYAAIPKAKKPRKATDPIKSTAWKAAGVPEAEFMRRLDLSQRRQYAEKVVLHLAEALKSKGANGGNSELAAALEVALLMPQQVLAFVRDAQLTKEVQKLQKQAIRA